MHVLLDEILVAGAVFVSLVYAVFALGPRSLRSRSLAAVAALAARLPPFLGLQPLVQRLQIRAARKSKGSCGGCDDCGSGAAPTPDRAEFTIAVSSIGKRGSREPAKELVSKEPVS